MGRISPSEIRLNQHNDDNKLKPYMAEHERKVEFLETLAVLAECRIDLQGGLPDGCLPDVLRADTEHGLLFIGDAKHTETPGSSATQARLRRYMNWMATHVQQDRIGIFCICFSRTSDATGWCTNLAKLAKEAGIAATRPRVQWFEDETAVAWVTCDGLLNN